MVDGEYGENEFEKSPSLVIFLCGDVMTGRGIDQALPYSGNSKLHEPYVRYARDYVKLAEKANGPIQRPVSFKYVWGDALSELERAKTDVRIINLETSITTSNDHWRGKGIHYRMSPKNMGCLTAAGINGCSLANNHVLDWGYDGLAETLNALDRAGIHHAGAGCDFKEATDPAIIETRDKGRVLLFSFGLTDSGIFPEWSALRDKPGVNLLRDLSEETASRIASQMQSVKQKGDIAIASIHWGGNWGYDIPGEQKIFAHRLIEEDFDLVHGHSSHHIKAIEVFKERLILYGCGDFINDYEGISGYEEFRADLSLMYLVTTDSNGGLVGVRLVPMQIRQFRLHYASTADAAWLASLLNWLGASLGTQVEMTEDHAMNLKW